MTLYVLIHLLLLVIETFAVLLTVVVGIMVVAADRLMVGAIGSGTQLTAVG